jgi:hypothetical protein
MEAQPIAVILALLTRIFVGPNAMPSLNAGAIALLALGLLWWTLLVTHFAHNRFPADKNYATWLYLLGLFVAFAILVGPYLPSVFDGANIFPALFNIAIITWFWRQSVQRTEVGFVYEPVARSFKVGLGILLAALLMIILFPELHILADVLYSVFPVFFLAGLITLSLVRLGMLRRVHRASETPQSDPTRGWLLALTLFGAAMLAIVILIESIFSFSSFEVVLAALTPVWNGLGAVVNWILYVLVIVILTPIFDAFSWLFNLLHENGHRIPPPPPPGKYRPAVQPKGPVVFAPAIIALGRWIFLAVALIVLIIAVRAALNRLRAFTVNDDIDEVRESLDARSLLGKRLRDWFNRRRSTQPTIVLESLDPTSARAYYRTLLQEVALAQTHLARLPAETPAEYEIRLQAYLERQREEADGKSVLPADPATLDELTRLYAWERYGGKQTGSRDRSSLQSRVPQFIARLTGRMPTQRNL